MYIYDDTYIIYFILYIILDMILHMLSYHKPSHTKYDVWLHHNIVVWLTEICLHSTNFD